MSKALLTINDIHVNVDDKTILHGIDLTVHPGETHVIMGPNGAGKSTLGNALMGNPRYALTEGRICFDGEDLTEEGPEKRAAKGMFLSFQNPIEVPGLSLSSFIRSALEAQSGQKIKAKAFRESLKEAMDVLQVDERYIYRDLNVGFSGGEKKKAEILQLLMLNPKLAILDETDSGLDVDAVRTVSEGVKAYQKRQDGALLIITHSTRILESLHVDYTHILVDGRIVKTGGAELVDQVNREGFEPFLREEA